jgi:hypothetical protein
MSTIAKLKLVSDQSYFVVEAPADGNFTFASGNYKNSPQSFI